MQTQERIIVYHLARDEANLVTYLGESSQGWLQPRREGDEVLSYLLGETSVPFHISILRLKAKRHTRHGTLVPGRLHPRGKGRQLTSIRFSTKLRPAESSRSTNATTLAISEMDAETISQRYKPHSEMFVYYAVNTLLNAFAGPHLDACPRAESYGCRYHRRMERIPPTCSSRRFTSGNTTWTLRERLRQHHHNASQYRSAAGLSRSDPTRRD